jgi:hypothetical protein
VTSYVAKVGIGTSDGIRGRLSRRTIHHGYGSYKQ